MSELCMLLRRSRSLRELDLTKCSLRGAPLRQQTDALSTNTQLHSVNFRWNSLDAGDARCIADLRKKNRTLTGLDLFSTECGSALLAAELDLISICVYVALKPPSPFHQFLVPPSLTVRPTPLSACPHPWLISLFSVRRPPLPPRMGNAPPNANPAGAPAPRVAITEADVRRARAALIQQVQANNDANQSAGWPELNGARVDGKDIHWTESELSSLFRALHTNTHVTQLMLNGERMPLSAEMMQQFVEMLAVNRSLRLIILFDCTEGAMLAQGLKQHPMLEDLTSYNTKIFVGDMRAMILARVHCPALRSLDRRYNDEIIPAILPELYELLYHARSLRSLDLSQCRFRGAAMHKLADVMSSNANLVGSLRQWTRRR
jgi:hypothetical protein